MKKVLITRLYIAKGVNGTVCKCKYVAEIVLVLTCEVGCLFDMQDI